MIAAGGLLLITNGCGALLGIDDFVPRGGGLADAGKLPDAATMLDAADADPNPDAIGLTKASKVDLLLVVDDSPSMSDKAQVLATSIGTLLRRVATTGDVHVGVITSSLGSMGGDVCVGDALNSGAHLRTLGPDNLTVPSAASGVIAFGAAGSTDEEAFVNDVSALVRGVGQKGCGLEAQLESAYRFLVQPDPWERIVVDGETARYEGLDTTVLEQRKAFLRPDSLVVVVMLTDEDDSSPDPRSVGGLGWAYASLLFPGSTTFRGDGETTTAPRATSACALSPSSPACASCRCVGFSAACMAVKSDPNCQGDGGGYYGPDEDSLNTRFIRMKARFGVDPQFPIDRYVAGFTKQNVPDRDGEHAVVNGTLGDYLGAPTCTNPLFAATLPGPGEDTCHLPVGPRGKELVVFALVGGVPNQLLATGPDWKRIVGANPRAYDYAGQDPHMVASITPRPSLPPPSATPGDNGPDPIHGREWDTKSGDLQFACTFALPVPRNCSGYDPGCDCGRVDSFPPLCEAPLTSGIRQSRAKAYPTTRELVVAKELGDRAIVGSICPLPGTNYDLTMNKLADRLAFRLSK